MASSLKREHFLLDQSPSSGKKQRTNYDAHFLITNHHVVLNPADCDLDFNIEGNGLKGSALYEHGFAYCWSGARANIGITKGRYCFSCKIVSGQNVEMEDTPIDEQHLCRVGISTLNDPVGHLGETEHSFGFGGTGKFSNNGKFSSYGERFSVGDTILCAVDLDSTPRGSISFAKNGIWLGLATHFNVGSNWEAGFFPHVLLKNVEVQMQFSYEDGLVPQDGYRPWSFAFEDGKGVVGPAFSDVCNCELIMMVGLPGSGKTTWAEKWVNDHPERRYILLGTNLAMDKMKVPGLVRKRNYVDRFDRLMNRATAIFDTLLTRASKTPRNFIIDQTNVYKNARKRKLKPFANYHKIAVVVFPSLEDLKSRSEKSLREMGKQVSAEAVNEMIANYVLPKSKDTPGTDDYFDQVVYVELNMTESIRCLDEMKAKLQLDSGNSMRYSQENVLQPHAGLINEYPLENSTHFTHPTLGHIHTSPLQYQTTPSGGHMHGSHQSQPILLNTHHNDSNKSKCLLRDDFNHRRSYSGYEHRAITPIPMGLSVSYQSNSSNGPRVDYHASSNNDTMDISPPTANTNYHPAPTEHHPTFFSSPYGISPSAPRSKFQPINSVPYGSNYGSPDQMSSSPYVNHNSHVANYHRYQSSSRYC